MPTALDALPAITPDDPELVGERFHQQLRELAADHWLVRAEPFGHVVLARAEVDRLLRTPKARMPAIELLEMQGVTSGAAHEQLSGNLLNLHGEQHRRLRHLVQPSFTPQAADALRPAMRRHLDELLAAVAVDQPVDLVAALCTPYPSRMIAEIVGAPVDDAARLAEWAYWIQSTFDPTKVAGALDRIEEASAAFRDYVTGLLRDWHPSADDPRLLDALAEALDRGECDEAEAVALVGSVLLGGVDTTQAQLAHGLRLLSTHPAQYRALVDDPGLVSRAVDEILRFEPIAPFTARLTTDELTLRDVTFSAGEVLITCATTANRDPATYTEPERFDITADRGAERPLSFGAGPHFCLGHALARAELEEALLAVTARFAALEPAGEPTYDTPPGVYNLKRLPLVCRSR